MKQFVVHEARKSTGRTGRKLYIPPALAETFEWENPDERENDIAVGECDMEPEYFALLSKLVREVYSQHSELHIGLSF